MRNILRYKLLLIPLILVVVIAVLVAATREHQVDFSSEVKPIINKKCITCHGGVRAKGGFSLLFREEALAKTESGKPAIVPGNPSASEMIRRLNLTDPEERMPYKHEPLSKEEINTLTRWIKQGAKWGEHWAYIPPQPVQPPKLNDQWVKNDIDRFILEKLRQEKIQPSPEADKYSLLRRVSLDLTGMQPSSQVVQQYLQSNSGNAYSILVDSLLASPHFGEKWASLWLDLARYADTKGYERDDSRNIWLYRDWLIKAFNEDKPYNQFLMEQVAGDLLPNPTDAQYIATAFHRNTMTNDEGGTDNEEFRTAAVLDRVNTTWEALMGTTFACAQCHSHPYDPFTQDEYYQFMAYFNDSRDEDSQADYPLLRHFNDSLREQLAELSRWVQQQAGTERAQMVTRFLRTWQPSINSLTADKFVNSELADVKWLIFRNHGAARLRHVDLQSNNHLIYRYIGIEDKGTWKLHLDSATGEVFATVNAKKTKGWEITAIDFPPLSGIHDVYITYENPSLKKPEQSGLQFDWFYFTTPFPGKGKADYEKYNTLFWKLLTVSTSTVPIMMDNPPVMHRVSNVFVRGNWLVKGKAVEPSVPHSLSVAMPAGAPKNRMGLALWLTSKKNPLVARTMVNRLWEQLFGTGIVETLEDMGTQGMPPTHRELLDYLSYEFMNDYKWSLKSLLKEIVMSATYRQDSKLREDLKEKDLFNKLYARGPRVRLSAEQVRDQALCFTGMMNEKMYGPSVFPYQPKGIWLSPWNNAEWKMSDSAQQYRRAVYTYWKRTAPYPAMITFDVASRELCTPRRVRTNTPLQALVTLNDSAYVDMSRRFAWRMQREGGAAIREQIGKGYEWMVYRPITPAKLNILMKLYDEALATFKKKEEAATAMNGYQEKQASAETAALTVVANAMLNLDEVITKS